MNLTINYTPTLEDFLTLQHYHRKAVKSYPFKHKSRSSRAVLGYILMITIGLLLFFVVHDGSATPATVSAPSPATPTFISQVFLSVAPYAVLALVIFFIVIPQEKPISPILGQTSMGQ
jgi:uncharacterized BrkB/YihY/UPF0761 family membrane protein